MQDSNTIIIVGAGPVGLLLAALLDAREIPCTLVDRRTSLPRESRAIGVTPPSLELLSRIHLAGDLVGRGVRVRDATVWDEKRRLGGITFRRLPSRFPFILAVPQRQTMAVLESRVLRSSRVTCRMGEEFVGMSMGGVGVQVRLRSAATGAASEMRGSLLVGCDGHRSTVREQASFRWDRRLYGAAFSMADFEDRTELGDEAHLFFTRYGAVESFPLPGRRRRWIAQTDAGPDDLTCEDLVDGVYRRSGYRLDAGDAMDLSWFRPERLCCRHFADQRVLLCGDAAHVMSPVGGQGMNTGFADADLAARVIVRWLRGESWTCLREEYTRKRSRAFNVAADRAAVGMWVGTRKGAASRLRSALLRYVALRGPLRDYLPLHFSMLTIPHARPPAGGIREAWA